MTAGAGKTGADGAGAGGEEASHPRRRVKVARVLPQGVTTPNTGHDGDVCARCSQQSAMTPYTGH